MERSKKMPHLCSKDMCTACSACYNSCNRQAISMIEDEYGELYPQIDCNLCVGCGACESACPELNKKLTRNSSPKIYACWLKDKERRAQSTSGGAAFAISAKIIEKGGHVWGAAYKADLSLFYSEANTIKELEVIQKSKYLQCHIGNAFQEIKEELDRGETVLFVGTGCHVKGLRSFLSKDYPNLLTADLVCHGVPGQGVFRRYKEWLEVQYDDVMTGYVPRPKRSDGQEVGYYALAQFKGKGNVKLERRNNSYFVGFQHNLFLRNSCYHCQANGEKRYSDFTLGDFWGLGKVKQFTQYRQRTLGISMLALNSEKAKRLFDECKENLVYEERTYEEASFVNTQYYKSAVPSSVRERFLKDWLLLGWDELVDKYMMFSKKEYMLYCIKKITPPICYYMLNYWRNGKSK